MREESWGKRIWRLIYPGLTYLAVCYIVEVIALIPVVLSRMKDIDAGMLGSMTDSEVLMMENAILDSVLEQAFSMALEVQVVAAAITLPILILFYRRDRRQEARLGQVHRFTAVPSWQYLPAAVLGMAACLAGNNLMAVSGLYQISDAYDEIAEMIYGGKLVVEFVGLGIIVPLVEEMIFRGLMYRRMRKYMNVSTAAVICSLIFGFYHGNLVQGIYAFCLSLLMIYVYERFHSMLAPMLFHVAANTLSVLVSETGFLDGVYRTAGAFWSCTILACAVLIGAVYFIERFVLSEEIINVENSV